MCGSTRKPGSARRPLNSHGKPAKQEALNHSHLNTQTHDISNSVCVTCPFFQHHTACKNNNVQEAAAAAGSAAATACAAAATAAPESSVQNFFSCQERRDDCPMHCLALRDGHKGQDGMPGEHAKTSGNCKKTRYCSMTSMKQLTRNTHTHTHTHTNAYADKLETHTARREGRDKLETHTDKKRRET